MPEISSFLGYKCQKIFCGGPSAMYAGEEMDLKMI